MADPTRIRTYAVQCIDGISRVHSGRALAADGRGYTSTLHEPTFATEGDARTYAIEVLGADPDDIAPDAGVR